jgi:tetratricopeptide (TPR) repeat protein
MSQNAKMTLGELLHGLLEERSRPVPSARRYNPAVSPAAAAILGRCLEPDPAHRYQSASQVREDLQRQLESQPLKYAREPSVRERVRKKLRRSPRLLTKLAVGATVVAAIAAAVFGLWYYQDKEDHRRALAQAEAEHEAELAREAEVNREHEAAAAAAVFHSVIRDAQFWLNNPEADDQLDASAERVRQALGRYGLPDDRDWRDRPDVRRLPATELARLEQEVGESLLRWARAGLRASTRPAADPTVRKRRLQEALHLNELAEDCLGNGAAVRLQRAELLKELGDADKAAALRRQAEGLPPTARDLRLRAGDHMLHKRFKEAVPLLDAAAALDPKNDHGWFQLGVCHQNLGAEAKAAACYSNCLVLAPDFFAGFFNRGLAYLRQREYELARTDFTRVIELNPGLPDGYVNRALALRRLNRYPEAIADMTRALERGSETRVLFQRARLRKEAKDPEGAEADFAEGLRREPTTVRDWVARGLARVEKEDKDPHGALADFDRALALNPGSRHALQSKASVLSEELGRAGEAVKLLDEVLRLNPDFLPARSGRGVLHARLGNRADALADATAVLGWAKPTDPRYAELLFQVGCIYALTSRQNAADRELAVRYLRDGVRGGFGANLVATDADLKPLHGFPAFEDLRKAAEALKPR